MTVFLRLTLVITGAVLVAIALLYPATEWAPPGLIASTTSGALGSLALLRGRSRRT